MHSFRLDRTVRALVAAAFAASVALAPAALAQGTYVGEADRVTTIPAPPSPYTAPPAYGYGPPPGDPQSYPPPDYPPPQADAPGPGYAPAMPPDAGAQGAPYVIAQDELDGLVAPVALYPDELLAQVFMAATFPLDVVEAARFVRENPNLTGRALDDAVASRRWDPSVLSLAAFPQVLAMMNEHLDWTRRLGEAFLADQDRVMQTVQDLRFRAQQAGTLRSSAQQNVIVQDRAIYIEPAQPDVVYVPVYNPTVVYGSWWVPTYVPWYWRPAGVYFAGPVGFYGGYRVGSNHWGWARPDWSHRHIAIDLSRHNRFIERRPYYRDAVQDGHWQAPGDGRWQGGDRSRAPLAGSGAPQGNGRADRPARVDGRVMPDRQGFVPGPRESGNEAGMGQTRVVPDRRGFVPGPRESGNGSGMAQTRAPRGGDRAAARGEGGPPPGAQARSFHGPAPEVNGGASTRPVPQRVAPVGARGGEGAGRQVERAYDGGARRAQGGGERPPRSDGKGEGRQQGEGRSNDR